MRYTGHHITIAPLDLPAQDVIADDGTHMHAQVDPSTGLLMAGERINVPAGLVLGVGDRSTARLMVGSRVLVQRTLRQNAMTIDTEHGPIAVERVPTVESCIGCGRDMPRDSIIAVIRRDGSYQATGARLIAKVDPPEEQRGGILLVEQSRETLTGRVVSVGGDTQGVMVGARVVWTNGSGAYWRHDGVEYSSQRMDRACTCGRVRHGSVLGVARGE